MGVKDVFGIGKSDKEYNPTDEYLEIEMGDERPGKSILVQVENLSDFNDADRINRKIREGNIVLAKIKDLKNKDVTELKRSIEKIRKTCLAINGDIAGVGDEWLIVTPNFAKIHRESAE
jgi:SepF-like predicted cell division protein (DUF552 family)